VRHGAELPVVLLKQAFRPRYVKRCTDTFPGDLNLISRSPATFGKRDSDLGGGQICGVEDGADSGLRRRGKWVWIWSRDGIAAGE